MTLGGVVWPGVMPVGLRRAPAHSRDQVLIGAGRNAARPDPAHLFNIDPIART